MHLDPTGSRRQLADSLAQSAAASELSRAGDRVREVRMVDEEERGDEHDRILDDAGEFFPRKRRIN